MNLVSAIISINSVVFQFKSFPETHVSILNRTISKLENCDIFLC